MRGGFLEGIHDAIEMVLRVGLKVRVPNGLFAEDHFAIDESCDFAVAATKIETDATAFQVPAEGGGVAAFRWQIFGMHDFEWMIEHAFSDDAGIEFARRCVLIIRRKFFSQ